MIVLGIDPGIGGGLALLTDSGLKLIPTKDTEAILAAMESTRGQMVTACIEQVHSMPKQGVASTFTFGENFGWWQGLLTGYGIPFTRVSPQRWQKSLSVSRKGMTPADGKRALKRLAIELFPNVKITNATADAALIAEYFRRERKCL